MASRVGVRGPWLNVRLVVNLRTLNNRLGPKPPRTTARLIFRCGLSICLPLIIAYVQAAVLCGICLAVCDIFLGQPSIQWYKTLHLLTGLCAAPWFYCNRHWVISGVWPVFTMVRSYIVDTVASYRTSNRTGPDCSGLGLAEDDRGDLESVKGGN